MKKIKVLTFLSILLLWFVCLNQQMAAQTNIGDTAPNIKLPDENKQEQLLSALKGKFVLLYFWVSWDPNSRINNPNLSVVRNKYKDVVFSGGEKGFEVFSVSLDSDRDEWLAALRKDKMQGVAVNDAYSKYAGVYKITNITTSFLLDGNGKIVAKDLSMSQLDKTLAGFATNYVVTNTNTKTTTTAPAKTTISNNTAAATYNTTGKVNESTATKGQKYRIQLGAYRNLNLSQFSNVTKYGNIISEPTESGVKRILLGDYASPEEAVMTLNNIKTSGYPDAFVTIYKNDARNRVMSKAEVLAVNEYLNAASSQNNSAYASLTPETTTATATSTQKTSSVNTNTSQQTSGSIATTVAPSTTQTTTKIVDAPIQISVFETNKATAPSTGTYYDRDINIANTTSNNSYNTTGNVSQPTQVTSNTNMPAGTGISESYTRTEIKSPSYASHPASQSGSNSTTQQQGTYNTSPTNTHSNYSQQGTYTKPTQNPPTYTQQPTYPASSGYGSGSSYNTNIPQSGGQIQGGYNVGNSGSGSSDAVRQQQEDASEVLDKALNEYLNTYETKKANVRQNTPNGSKPGGEVEEKETDEAKRTKRSFWKRLTGKR